MLGAHFNREAFPMSILSLTTAPLAQHLRRRAATRAEIIKTRTPNATETHVPIPHILVVEEVETALRQLDLEVVAEAFGLYRDGQRFIGLLELRPESPFADYGIVVGVFNSHDKSRPAGAALGSRVYQANTLAFSGEVTFARKHTLNILADLPNRVAEGIARLVEARGRQEERIQSYKELEVTDAEAHDLLIRAYDKRALPVTALPAILKAWREPEFLTFYARNAWSLFNAVTANLGGNLAELPRRTQALHALMDQAAGVNAVAPGASASRPQLVASA